MASRVMGGRVTLRPVGSPIMPVMSPIRKMTVWPRSWKCFILRSRTVWPRCRSGAVGSKPALTRSGRPVLAACDQPLAQVLFADDLRHAFAEVGELFVDGHAMSDQRSASAAASLYCQALQIRRNCGWLPPARASAGDLAALGRQHGSAFAPHQVRQALFRHHAGAADGRQPPASPDCTSAMQFSRTNMQ